jgi:hypothetical protein
MKQPAMLVALLVLAGNACAVHMHDAHTGHAGHATPTPIGVMGDHLHPQGDWMVSYRYMHMDMEGSLKGSDHISNKQIISPAGENYLVTPTEMTMDMHMLGVMYAPTGNLTLMAMAPYIKNSMDHRTRMGTTFTTGSEGIGDVQLGALYGLMEWNAQHLHLNFGISTPTGSIDEKDHTPMGRGRLPYPMQLGSGTWDLVAGLTYGGREGKWAWGSQATGTVRLQDENDNDYRLGNRLNVTGWLIRDIARGWNASLRIDGQAWGDIRGADPKLNKNVVPTADPDLRGGKRIDALAGVNYVTRGGVHKGHTFGIEAGAPAWQDLDGPQLRTRWTVMAGWQYSF